MGIDAEMLVRTNEQVTDKQVRRWAYELGGAFGADAFNRISVEDVKRHGLGGTRHNLYRVEVYQQDGPTIKPENGETFMRVALFCRFYGIGYERGPIDRILAICRWIEDRIPGATVWYGGDSSGTEARPLTGEYADQLWAHFVQHATRPYYQGFERMMDDPFTRMCDFCDEAMVQFGWRPGDRGAKMRCSGCGLSESTTDGGKTWKNDDRCN